LTAVVPYWGDGAVCASEPDVKKLDNPAWSKVIESFWGLFLARGQAFLKEDIVLPFGGPFVSIEPIVYRQLGFDCFFTVACFFHFAPFLFLSTMMAILFRIDSRED